MAMLKNCYVCGKEFYGERDICLDCRDTSADKGEIPYCDWESLGSKVGKVIKNEA